MKIYHAILRKWFVKRYIKIMMERVIEASDRKKKFAKTLQEKDEIHQIEAHELEEYGCWLESIEDAELIKKAEKMEIWLDDIPLVEGPPDEIPGYLRIDEYGNQRLFYDIRRQLKDLIRSKGPAYRKERRETYEFYFKAIGGFTTAIAGLGGIIIGIISVLHK